MMEAQKRSNWDVVQNPQPGTDADVLLLAAFSIPAELLLGPDANVLCTLSPVGIDMVTLRDYKLVTTGVEY
jgi:hypothetical protein